MLVLIYVINSYRGSIHVSCNAFFLSEQCINPLFDDKCINNREHM